ncbi:hypothetical protein RV134_260047 [Roseovarius sp. EC-HK134]|nr:hypothetical protein RV134_260047 [Roseovarius sp. EC-HK134]VVT08739.1 hypothetical protein RV420_290263 [Roseovarius sp. EC-SD190]
MFSAGDAEGEVGDLGPVDVRDVIPAQAVFS